MLPPRFNLLFGFVCLLVTGTSVLADESLANRIDSLIEADSIGPAAPLASDAEFLRRATLDLHGLIPTSTEARAFLDDPDPKKRELLIDRLLSRPRFAVHMANFFDVMLMERRVDKHVTTPEWQKFLQESFENNVPFDQLAKEILSADGVDLNRRPAAKFFLDRDAEPHTMTRDIGRVFFGMDLQCAQCHDHPLVDHYLQTDYYGLFAFVNRTIVFTDEAAKKSFLAEKSDGDATYKSVFTQDSGQIRPQLPGENEIDEPRLRQGEDYVAPPLPGVRPEPKYSRRKKLAELATNGLNRQFNLNIANRLWAHMMGRGLVHPVDLHHPRNPPTHPAVLDLIAHEFIAMKYDTRSLLRQLALTRAYQRSIETPTDATSSLATAAKLAPQISSESASLKSIADESHNLVEAAQTTFKSARSALAPAEAAWRTTEATVTAAKKPVDDALAAVAKSQNEAAAKQLVINAVNEAAGKSTEAAKLVPNDKELAAAVATLTAKQAQLATELTTVQKAISDQTVALQPLQAKLIEAYAPADAAYAAYVEARKPVDATKTALIATWNQHKADSQAAALRKQRQESVEAHLAFQVTVADLAARRAELNARKSELATAIAATEQQQLEVTKQTNLLAENEKSAAVAANVLAEAKTTLAAKQSAAQAVADACAKTEVALQQLPADVELTAILQKLKERLDPLTKQTAEFEQAAVMREVAMKEISATLSASKQGLAAAAAEMANRQQSVTEKTNAVNLCLESVRQAESNIGSASEKLAEIWTIEGGVRSMKQLSPEQMGWALMQSTGIVEPQIPAADAEVEKTIPKANVANDIGLAKARELKVQQQLNEIMRGNVAPFVSLYGASAGQPQDDFFATPDQALFVANGGTVIGWAAGGQLAQRLAPLTDAKAFAEELYLSTLTRRPNEAELNEVSQYLASRPTQRSNAIRELVWSLVTSAEFRFNH